MGTFCSVRFGSSAAAFLSVSALAGGRDFEKSKISMFDANGVLKNNVFLFKKAIFVDFAAPDQRRCLHTCTQTERIFMLLRNFGRPHFACTQTERFLDRPTPDQKSCKTRSLTPRGGVGEGFSLYMYLYIETIYRASTRPEASGLGGYHLKHLFA